MTEKCEFIDAEKDNYPIQSMCVWLEISTSGFYDWRSRPASATTERREELKALIRYVFMESDETYGYRRVHAALARKGVQAGLELVRALMRELGLVPCQPKPWRTTTIPDNAADAVPDLMKVRIQKEWADGWWSARVAGQVVCAMGGIQRLPVKARWMASKAVRPCLRAESR